MARYRISVRDLRYHGGDVLQRVQAGEHVIITKSGKPVAEIHPLRVRALGREELVARWRNLPRVDPAAFRRDLDDALGSTA